MTRRISFHVALAVGILAVAAALRYAQQAGVIEAEAGKRSMQVAIGLWLAFYGNFMPKNQWVTSVRVERSVHAAARAQSALRVGGWAMTLGGLSHAAFWALAPMGVAPTAARAAVAAAAVVTAGYGAWILLTCRPRSGRGVGA